MREFECIRNHLSSVCVRMGKRQKFDDTKKAQCRMVSMAVQREVGMSVHENVVGYDEASCCI